jgi:hypothetical protein
VPVVPVVSVVAVVSVVVVAAGPHAQIPNIIVAASMSDITFFIIKFLLCYLFLQDMIP